MVDSSPIKAMSVSVSVDQLRAIHRDLDACQKVIWLAGVRPRGYGFDPAYCEDAQARLREIEALIETATIAQTEQQPSAVQQILDLILEQCRYWHGRDEARRGGFACLYAQAKEIADKVSPIGQTAQGGQ